MNYLFIILIFYNILFLFFLNKNKILFPLDYPSLGRKKHKKPTPKIGNFLFFSNILIIIGYFYFQKDTQNLINLMIFENKQTFLIFFYLLSLSFFGFLEDKSNYKPGTKTTILLVLISALLYFNTHYQIKFLLFNDVQIFLNNSTLLISAIILFSLKNIFNLLDGINGLVASYFLGLSLVLMFKNFYFIVYILPSLVFFLFINLKNKAFMGDGGIFILTSFFYICFVVNYNNKLINIPEILILLIIPMIDTARLFLKRLLKGKSPFVGDRNHLHHILLNKFGINLTLIIIISVSFLPYVAYHTLEVNLWIPITFQFLIYLFIIYNRKIKFFLKKVV